MGAPGDSAGLWKGPASEAWVQAFLGSAAAGTAGLATCPTLGVSAGTAAGVAGGVAAGVAGLTSGRLDMRTPVRPSVRSGLMNGPERGAYRKSGSQACRRAVGSEPLS